MRRATLALTGALLAAGLLPATASAHVGRTPPAATRYLARITSIPAGLEARIVDGDQGIWLRADPSSTVVVSGLRGEPYLRFSPAGVAVNTRSATWFLNRVFPLVVPPGITRTTKPQWKPLTARHSWTWHEGRLHVPALAAHPAGNVYVGRWVVPLVVDGRAAAIRGGLWQSTPPSLLWFWPLLLVAACVPALWKLREAGLDVWVASVLAGLALVSATLARVGRELYGRPADSAWQLVLVGVSCLVALALGVLYTRPGWRAVGGLLIGAVAVYQGAVLVSTLRDGWVLAAIPAWIERGATAVSFASGAALILVSMRMALPDRDAELETELLAEP